MSTTYGIPNRPSGSNVRSISALLGNFDYITAALNDLDGDNITDGTLPLNALTSADAAKLGVNGVGVVRRGKTNIATSESRTNAAYGLLTTTDRVQNLVLPTDGLIFVAYQATWQNSVANAGRAAIFLGANQLQVASQFSAPPVVQESSGVTNAASDASLGSGPQGLSSLGGGSAYTGDVTTGQVLGSPSSSSGGPVAIFAAAGTYDVSVQFKSASGSVTVKNRKLWVWTLGF